MRWEISTKDSLYHFRSHKLNPPRALHQSHKAAHKNLIQSLQNLTEVDQKTLLVTSVEAETNLNRRKEHIP